MFFLASPARIARHKNSWALLIGGPPRPRKREAIDLCAHNLAIFRPNVSLSLLYEYGKDGRGNNALLLNGFWVPKYSGLTRVTGHL